MESKRDILNNLLVVLFNNILTIEEKALKTGDFKNLTISELHVIEAVGLEKAPNMTRIANRLGVTVGTLTIAVNNLVRKGYVQRVRDENDRRVVKIGLTDTGEAAYRHHEAFHDDMIEFVIRTLSDGETGVLVEALSKITLYFEEKYGEGIQ
ncbi:MarR family transcriptional regulator [Fusibacter paucivorans]|uniref:MarR family transcriptional regulator n=1 Tax=Fusibacter paucivorans TaxID=76009 RepID=A0ABS5PLQ2_9FIRM|nr:MarR family transcriptional regulator [Fusibacter paucivorans]MBS7526094.1 MarR family transcriptional regulator [Fusibacter paucivorans]